MLRRAIFVLAFAACCTAAGDPSGDPAGEVLDLFTNVAASLSAGSVSQFMAAFDSAMPGYAQLRDNVTALIAQGDIQSFIDPVENEGTETRRAVEWKWKLRIKRLQDPTASDVREENVKAQVEKRAGKWRITQFEPVSFFAPAK
uniref:DUF3828 domain-containing protein n=1 Tax=Solibacter usitatus (strain Ellin6076) TaxID=234267 RepID=Q023V3_SOLUE